MMKHQFLPSAEMSQRKLTSGEIPTVNLITATAGTGNFNVNNPVEATKTAHSDMYNHASGAKKDLMDGARMKPIKIGAIFRLLMFKIESGMRRQRACTDMVVCATINAMTKSDFVFVPYKVWNLI